VHVRAGSKEAKFWLHDLATAVNMGFPAHELGDIIRPFAVKSRTAIGGLE
jgi:hypothetical protein